MDRPINIFDKAGSLIPGYTGYAERNNRRQCDKLLREKITSVIISGEKLLSKRIAVEIESGDHSLIEGIEECRKKLNTIRDKIGFAPYGESAFFSSAQLKEEELLVIYQKDFALLNKANQIYQTLPELNAAPLFFIIGELEDMLTERNEYIKEFK
jgi:hypothetical protein